MVAALVERNFEIDDIAIEKAPPVGFPVASHFICRSAQRFGKRVGLRAKNMTAEVRKENILNRVALSTHSTQA
jgi:hypothetical protein